MIDELLEELGGAKLLTKLDLLFVYYQVAMYSPNIEKIAFWTHHVHFEFLVIAVWTLQHPFHLSDLDEWDISSLLEEIYSGFLWLYFNFQSEHGQNIFTICCWNFQLTQNKLFLEFSKCTFAQT